MNSQHKLVISVERAREILGNEAQNMTDGEIEKLILDLDFFAKAALDMARKERLETKKEEAFKSRKG